MALKRRFRVEDIIIGIFVMLALFYPLFVIVLIEFEEKAPSSDRLNVMRDTYLFITGLEDCSPEVASHIASYMERELLHRVGGVAGLVRLCRQNRKSIKGTVSVRESIDEEGHTLVLTAEITFREKGIPRSKKKVRVIAFVDENIKIRDIRYAEGD